MKKKRLIIIVVIDVAMFYRDSFSRLLKNNAFFSFLLQTKYKWRFFPFNHFKIITFAFF
jgi:hypothetical protein